jgi:hypothetical protein
MFSIVRRIIKGELAILRLRRYLEWKLGRPVSREEALLAYRRYRIRNPRKDTRLH